MVIADDHPVVRGGVRALMRSETAVRIVAEAGDSSELLAAVRVHRPHLALVDLHMPGLPADAVAERIRETSPSTRIVVLTMEADPTFAARMLQAGVAGYVLKDSAPFTLIDALRTALRGGVYLEPAIGAKLARLRAESPSEILTSRERDVLAGVARGFSNREIAASLSLSVRTVESHRAQLQQKLGIRGAVRLSEFARRHRIAPPDGVATG